MSNDPQTDAATVHQELSALIPWYVNSTIGEQERERLDEHLGVCAVCRDDLAHEREVCRVMTADAPIEYMPAASLKRLQARLDGIAAGAAQAAAAAPPTARGRSLRWQGLMAASVAVMAVALGLLAADRWMQVRARAAASDYYTVTNPVPRARGEVIRAVFSPTLTLVELQRILDESQLRIISGPSEAGVYSLAANSRRTVGSSLALLRAHSEVRFAESTQTGPNAGAGAGNSP